jgi:hypothetical protein
MDATRVSQSQMSEQTVSLASSKGQAGSSWSINTRPVLFSDHSGDGATPHSMRERSKKERCNVRLEVLKEWLDGPNIPLLEIGFLSLYLYQYKKAQRVVIQLIMAVKHQIQRSILTPYLVVKHCQSV